MSKKMDIIRTLLNCDHILVFVNPKTEGIRLPQYLLNEESVTLKLSKYFQGELVVADSLIQAVLKFNGVYYTCILPEHSIWGAMTPDGQSTIWLDCAPDPVKLQAKQTSETESKNLHKSRPILKRVK